MADNTLYNFVYKPAITRIDHKTVLENCVYLIPWNTAAVWWLAKSLSRRHNLALGALANVLAAWRYQLDFCANPALVWIRRLWIAARMVTRRDFKTLRRRLAPSRPHST